jgi:hypothetical protein
MFPILGVDPGATIGLALWELVDVTDHGMLGIIYTVELTLNDIDWPQEAAFLGDVILDSKTIVVEKFVDYSHVEATSPAQEVWGGIQMAIQWTWGEAGTGPEVITHRSKEASVVDYPMIQRWLELSVPHHSLDAVRVVMYELIERQRN